MDIVEWLRQFKLSTSDSNYNALIVKGKTEEAADEIERLRRLNSEYREALEYIADMPDGWEEDEELNLMFVVDNHVKVASDVLLGPLANDKDCV